MSLYYDDEIAIATAAHPPASVLKPMLAWGNRLSRGFAENDAREAGKLVKSKAMRKNKTMKKGVTASIAEVIIKAAEKRYDAERAKYLAALQTFNASGLDTSFAKSFDDDAAAEKAEDADELRERKQQHVRFLTLRMEKVAWTSPLPDVFSKVNTQSKKQWGVVMPGHMLQTETFVEKAKATYALTLLNYQLKHAVGLVPRYTALLNRSKSPTMNAHYREYISRSKATMRSTPSLIVNVEAYIASPQCRHSILLERTCELTGLIAMMEALVTSAATWATEQAEMEQFCSAQRARNSAARAWESSCSSSDSDEDGIGGSR